MFGLVIMTKEGKERLENRIDDLKGDRERLEKRVKEERDRADQVEADVNAKYDRDLACIVHDRKLEAAETEKDHELEVKSLEKELELVKKEQELNVGAAVTECAKGMEKSLIESDLARVEAVAKLETYLKMDSKDDKDHMKKMLEKSIEGLSAVAPAPQITVQK